MRQQEHFEAVALMKWWAHYSRAQGIEEDLLAAIPNGGHRHIGVARKMKAEGVRCGIPDYAFFVSRGGYNGFLIELKTPKTGRVSPDQKRMMELLSKHGYLTFVAFGWLAAAKALENYLRYGRTELP